MPRPSSTPTCRPPRCGERGRVPPRESTALSIIIRHDPATLREEVDTEAALGRLTEIGALRSLAALDEKVELLRLLGRIDEAWDIANEAVRRTRFSGDRAELISARVRRARLMHVRGKSDEALSELTLCVDESRTHEWHQQHAFALRNRALVLFDAEEFASAARDFDAASALGARIGLPEEELELARLGFIAATEGREESLRERRQDSPARGRRRADDE